MVLKTLLKKNPNNYIDKDKELIKSGLDNCKTLKGCAANQREGLKQKKLIIDRKR